MKKNKMGFLLIEWMAHFLLLSILFLVAATLIISWHKNVIGMGRLCDHALSIYLAADVMRNDLHNAHTITHDAKGLHIEHPNIALVWQYDGNAVWRQKTVFEEGSWNKPSKSLFAKGVHKSNFTITSLSQASQATLVTWQANDETFLFCSRNGLLL